MDLAGMSPNSSPIQFYTMRLDDFVFRSKSNFLFRLEETPLKMGSRQGYFWGRDAGAVNLGLKLKM